MRKEFLNICGFLALPFKSIEINFALGLFTMMIVADTGFHWRALDAVQNYVEDQRLLAAPASRAIRQGMENARQNPRTPQADLPPEYYRG